MGLLHLAQLLTDSSGLNGWIDCTAQYAGVGVPGSNTGSGGNGSNGCAFTQVQMLCPLAVV
jgi:hypothetical protein